MQAESCDNGNCYDREFAFDDCMDLDTLRRLKEEKGDTQKGLAALLGLQPDQMSKVFAGKRKLTAKEVDTLRRYYGLAGDPAEQPHMLPIVGLMAAGSWREGFENVTGHMPSPDRHLSSDAFVVIIEGDSMDKVAREGVGIIVDPRDLDLVSGKYYVVRNGCGETTFKQYRDNPARLEPCSTNETHRTIYPGRDEFVVIGRVRKRVEDL